MSELVSEAKFPASWENTGNFLDSDLGSAIRTRNFLRPYRELNRANREILARIRESRAGPRFGDSPWLQLRSFRQISNVAEKANKDAP